MKHCKRILLLVVVMVILIAGLSCTAFASSQTGAEDWRIEGNNGEAVTLYPGLEFSTQSAKMIPSWAGWISEIDKNVFENAYFDESKKLLYLKVNEDLTSNTKTTFKLRGSWLRSKTITVYVNVGPKYLPNLTLGTGEERIARLPYGVKSAEVVEGSENVFATKYGNYVLVRGKAEGTARVSVQYYKEDKSSIEAYEFKVSVCDQELIDCSTFGDCIPLERLGFAPDTPFVINEGKGAEGVELVKECVNGKAPTIYLKLTEEAKKGDVFTLTVPYATKVEDGKIVGWQRYSYSDRKPTVYTLHNGYQEENLVLYNRLRKLLTKVPVNSDEKVWLGGKDINNVVKIETPVLQDGFSETATPKMCKFYFIYWADQSAPFGTGRTLSITVVTKEKAKQYSITGRGLEKLPDFHIKDRQAAYVASSEKIGRFLRADKVGEKLKFNPERVTITKQDPKDPQYIDLCLKGVERGETVIYDECDDAQYGYKAVNINVYPKIVRVKAYTYTDVETLQLASHVGDFGGDRCNLEITPLHSDGSFDVPTLRLVSANYDVETDMLRICYNANIGSNGSTIIKIENLLTGQIIYLPYTILVTY